MNHSFHKTNFTIKDHKHRRFKNGENYFSPIVLVVTFIILSVVQGKAQEYPLKNLPDTIVATLNVETTKTEPFNNKLLGYNISRFTSGAEKDLIKKFDPITIRFPQGIFSNWYDWRIDDFTFYSPWIDESHKAVVNGQPKAGVAGLEVIQRARFVQIIGEEFYYVSINFDN